MTKPKPLSDDGINKLLVTLTMMSLKFDGHLYKIFDQDAEIAEAK